MVWEKGLTPVKEKKNDKLHPSSPDFLQRRPFIILDYNHPSKSPARPKRQPFACTRQPLLSPPLSLSLIARKRYLIWISRRILISSRTKFQSPRSPKIAQNDERWREEKRKRRTILIRGSFGRIWIRGWRFSRENSSFKRFKLLRDIYGISKGRETIASGVESSRVARNSGQFQV